MFPGFKDMLQHLVPAHSTVTEKIKTAQLTYVLGDFVQVCPESNEQPQSNLADLLLETKLSIINDTTFNDKCPEFMIQDCCLWVIPRVVTVKE